MSRTYTSLLILALAGLPAVAAAMGLGEIRLNSALNEPLDAEIELVSPSAAEMRVLKARIASRDTFQRYGLDRPEFLSSLIFEVSTGSRGQPVIKVSSRRPIAEPFVTFLVEANWESGRLLREYTVLLDPPVFMPGDTQAPPVAAPQTFVPDSAPSSGYVPPRSTPRAAPAARPTYEPAYSGTEYGPVRRNQNLWGIASELNDGSADMNQIMLAIYRANPEAFLGNINLLKEGSVLRIPDRSEFGQISQRQALSEAEGHNAAWRGRTGVPASGAADATATATAPRLRLVPPAQQQGDTSGTGTGTGASEAELEEAREMLTQAQDENARLNDELIALRDELQQQKRLVNLKSSELADFQARMRDAGVDGTETPLEPVDTTAPVSADEPAEAPVAETPQTVAGETPTEPVTTEPEPVTTEAPVQEPTATTRPVPVESPPGLVDRLLGLLSNFWLLGGLAVAALAGGLFAVLRARKQGDSDEAAWDSLDEVSDEATLITPRPAGLGEAQDFTATTAVEYSDDTGTFKPLDVEEAEAKRAEAPSATGKFATAEAPEYPFEDTLTGETSLKLDQSDPMAEADFHMAYGLYDQAAELVKNAAEREPTRRDLKNKLLEIYFVWGNKEQFLESANTLRNEIGSGPSAEWDKIVIMGKQICPDEDLFSGETLSGVADSGAIDLAFDENSSVEPALDMVTSDESGAVDLDLGDAFAAAEEEETAGAGDADNVIDFDIGGGTEVSSHEDFRKKIEAAAGDSQMTAEMGLDDLGLDIDLPKADEAVDVSADLSTDFDELFADAEASEDVVDVAAIATGVGDEIDLDLGFEADEDTDMPPALVDSADGEDAGDDAPTTEASLVDTAEMNVDFESELESLVDPDAGDSTERDLEAAEIDLDFSAVEEHKADPTGSFTAELEQLTSGDIDVDLLAEGADSDDLGGPEDVDIDVDLVATGAGSEFAVDVDLGAISAELPAIDEDTGDEDETAQLVGFDASDPVDMDLADLVDETVPAGSEDETAMSPIVELDEGELTITQVAAEADDFSADVFGSDSLGATGLTDLSTELLEADDDGGNDTTIAARILPDEDAFDDIFEDDSPAEDDEHAKTFRGVVGGAETQKVQDFSGDVFGPDALPEGADADVDLDIGQSLDERVDPTTVRVPAAELALPEREQTELNEVGTKLDLARAYVDMGDPEGARGILQEVLEEGDESQQSDARALLDNLP